MVIGKVINNTEWVIDNKRLDSQFYDLKALQNFEKHKHLAAVKTNKQNLPLLA